MPTSHRVRITGPQTVLTTDVGLVTPEPGMTTQRDANVSFTNRLEALEQTIDGGNY